MSGYAIHGLPEPSTDSVYWWHETEQDDLNDAVADASLSDTQSTTDNPFRVKAQYATRKSDLNSTITLSPAPTSGATGGDQSPIPSNRRPAPKPPIAKKPSFINNSLQQPPPIPRKPSQI
jgi:hypothetical protein